MTISAISATQSNASSNLQASSLGLQDFLKVLLTQLSYQDPLKPMDNQEFMAQIAQFTSVEQTQQLNTKIEALINNQAALQSVGLIGRVVDATTASGTLTGTVTALSLQGSSPSLSVKTASGAVIDGVSISQIIAVR